MNTLTVLLLAIGQDVVIEMNDGVREVRAGNTGIRVEVRNQGGSGSGGSLASAGAKFVTKEMLDAGELTKVWT